MLIKEKIVDLINETETIIEREETVGEREFRLRCEEQIAKEIVINAEKNAARLAILEKLGLTEEEAAVLLS